MYVLFSAEYIAPETSNAAGLVYENGGFLLHLVSPIAKHGTQTSSVQGNVLPSSLTECCGTVTRSDGRLLESLPRPKSPGAAACSASGKWRWRRTRRPIGIRRPEGAFIYSLDETMSALTSMPEEGSGVLDRVPSPSCLRDVNHARHLIDKTPRRLTCFCVGQSDLYELSGQPLHVFFVWRYTWLFCLRDGPGAKSNEFFFFFFHIIVMGCYS